MGPYRILPPDRPEPEFWEIEGADGVVIATAQTRTLAEKIFELLSAPASRGARKAIELPVSFVGTATVYVAATLEDADARRLAEHVALARILAATENPDAPEEDAFEEYVDRCSPASARSAESDWDGAVFAAVNGTWTVPTDPSDRS